MKAGAIISQIVADLRADVRLPKGQAAKADQFGLSGHWAAVATPDTLYFTNDGKQTGSVNPGTVPADAVFKATLTYMAPPTLTTSMVKITVSWPAAQSDPTKVAGSIDMFAAINR